MNSLTLKENGFADFKPLKDIEFTSLPYNKNSVLVLADCTLTGKPSSDILYIGKSKKPTKRILGGYLAGYGGKTTRKIHSMLFNDGLIEKVTVSWLVSDDSKTKQKELLEKFKKEHGEYPAWNVSKKAAQASQPLVKAAKTRPTRKSTKTSP